MATRDPEADSTPAFREGTQPTTPPARPRPGDAFALARAWTRQGRQLDMAALSAELGVSRGTLYRWTGDRDRLLADVVWADLAVILDHSWEHAEGRGAQRIERAVGAFLDAVAFQSAIRSLLANEGPAGLRMLTAPRGPVRSRLVSRVAEIIEAQVVAGTYRAPAPAAVLADGVVSLGERFLHNGGDPSLNPDPATAKTIVRLLLREPPQRP